MGASAGLAAEYLREVLESAKGVVWPVSAGEGLEGDECGGLREAWAAWEAAEEGEETREVGRGGGGEATEEGEEKGLGRSETWVLSGDRVEVVEGGDGITGSFD